MMLHACGGAGGNRSKAPEVHVHVPPGVNGPIAIVKAATPEATAQIDNDGVVHIYVDELGIAYLQDFSIFEEFHVTRLVDSRTGTLRRGAGGRRVWRPHSPEVVIYYIGDSHEANVFLHGSESSTLRREWLAKVDEIVQTRSED